MSAFKIPLYLLFLILIKTGISSGEEGPGDKELTLEKRLKDKLFKNYDLHLRPVYHHKNETVVAVELFPRYIVEFDEAKSILTVDGWILFTWEDTRLSWNASEYDGLETLHLPSNTIWIPDLYIYNSISSSVDPKSNTHVLILSDGRVYFVPPCELKTVCVTNPDESYPNDKVSCPIVMGSWTHDGNQINLTLFHDQIHTADMVDSNPNWELLLEKSSYYRHLQYYECCEEPYITIIMTLVLKRRTPQELQIIWVPCVLLMLLTLAMFWIPSGSGKKIILGAAIFLALSLLTVYVGAITKSPRAPLLAVRFLQSTMCATASAIILEIIVINLSMIVGPLRPPNVLVQFLSGPYGKFFAVWPRWESNIPGDKILLKEQSDQMECHPTANDEWILLSTLVDRFLFVLYVIVMSTIHKI